MMEHASFENSIHPASALSRRPCATIAALFLGLVAIAHGLRVLADWSIVLQGWEVPQWLSGIAALVLALLSSLVAWEARGRSGR